MAINLQKGQRVEIGLQKIGAGWGRDPNEGTETVALASEKMSMIQSRNLEWFENK